MNAKISLLAICVEGVIYLLLYTLHDCTFNICETHRYVMQPENQCL